MEEPSGTEQRPRQRRTFEYFLYAAIVVETALAAGFYKMILRSQELGHLSVYFGILYFAFLVWAIAQLNTLHRDRPLAPPAEEKTPVKREIAPADRRTILGLTPPQLVTVVVVFATAVATFSWALGALR